MWSNGRVAKKRGFKHGCPCFFIQNAQPVSISTTDSITEEKAWMTISTGVGFAVVVSDGDAKFCGQDSFKLKSEARFLARQVRPLLLNAQEYRWIDVEYSSCIPNDPRDDRSGCSGGCNKTIRLAVQDTAAWSGAIVRVRQEYHDYSPVQQL